MVVSANHFFESISEHEEEEHVSEKMGRTRMEEECCHEGPHSPCQQVVPAEHEIRIDEVGVLLPSPKAQADTSQYEQIIYSQPGPRLKRLDSQRPISEVPNYTQRGLRHSSYFVRAVCAKPFYEQAFPRNAFPLAD